MSSSNQQPPPSDQESPLEPRKTIPNAINALVFMLAVAGLNAIQQSLFPVGPPIYVSIVFTLGQLTLIFQMLVNFAAIIERLILAVGKVRRTWTRELRESHHSELETSRNSEISPPQDKIVSLPSESEVLYQESKSEIERGGNYGKSE